MQQREWSRSRYWHIHFLHGRHERPQIKWEQMSHADLARSWPGPLWCWLRAMTERHASYGPWLTRQVAQRFTDDPAYVQSLRLCLREQQHHRQLIGRLVADLDQPIQCRPPSVELLVNGGQILGPRFTLAVVLLADLTDLVLLETLNEQTEDEALKPLLGTILCEKRADVAFHVERLTWAFADFNFLSRNLRRYRLRSLFAVRLGRTVFRHGPAIHALGLGRSAFTHACWSRFETTLNVMVPYRRDALLRALLHQQENPYEKADSVE